MVPRYHHHSISPFFVRAAGSFRGHPTDVCGPADEIHLDKGESSQQQAESYVRLSVDKSAVLKYAQRAQVDLDSHHFTAATQISRRYCDHNVDACLGCRGPDEYIISGHSFLSVAFPRISCCLLFSLQYTNLLHLTSLESSPVTFLTLSIY
jgi:hypothetical protein